MNELPQVESANTCYFPRALIPTAHPCRYCLFTFAFISCYILGLYIQVCCYPSFFSLFSKIIYVNCREKLGRQIDWICITSYINLACRPNDFLCGYRMPQRRVLKSWASKVKIFIVAYILYVYRDNKITCNRRCNSDVQPPTPYCDNYETRGWRWRPRPTSEDVKSRQPK